MKQCVRIFVICIAVFMHATSVSRQFYYKSDLSSLILAAEGPATFIHRAIPEGEVAFRIGLEDAVMCARQNCLDRIKLLQGVCDHLERRIARIRSIEGKSFGANEFTLGTLWTLASISLSGLAFYLYNRNDVPVEHYEKREEQLQALGVLAALAMAAFVESVNRFRSAYSIHDDDHNLALYEGFLVITKDLQKKYGIS